MWCYFWRKNVKSQTKSCPQKGFFSWLFFSGYSWGPVLISSIYLMFFRFVESSQRNISKSSVLQCVEEWTQRRRCKTAVGNVKKRICREEEEGEEGRQACLRARSRQQMKSRVSINTTYFYIRMHMPSFLYYLVGILYFPGIQSTECLGKKGKILLWCYIWNHLYLNR